MSETSARLRLIADGGHLSAADRTFLRGLSRTLESSDIVSAIPGRTLPSDPRIPEGTRVRFTERPDEAGKRYYRGDRNGTGVVLRDDASHEVPYKFQRDGDPSWETALADYNELEILS